MEKINYGTKVLVFDDLEDKINCGFKLGTIVKGYDDDLEQCDYLRTYTVRDDERQEVSYVSCEYFESIMTPEDYKMYLLNELKITNRQIQELTEKSDDILNQLSKVETTLSEKNSNEKVYKKS